MKMNSVAGLTTRKMIFLAFMMILCLGAVQSAQAANIITNGSFENGFNGWTTAGGPAISPYGGSTLSVGSPDAGGGYCAYFSLDSGQQTLAQSVFLNPGTYEVGFDAYLMAFGGYYPATFTGAIAGIDLANVTINNPGLNNTWFHYQGLASVSAAGIYEADFIFQGLGYPANDVAIDRVYIARSDATGGTIIPSAVPEPGTMVLFGLGIAGLAAVCRSKRR